MREQAVAWVGSTAAKPGSERERKSPGQPSKTALAAAAWPGVVSAADVRRSACSNVNGSSRTLFDL